MKDWIGNEKSVYRNLGASNHSEFEREENDYYATDPKAIDFLFMNEKFDSHIWECCSGGGHLADRMKEWGKIVFSSDLIDRGKQDAIIDFLKCSEKESFNGDIITNPPYKYATEFILKALNLVNNGNKVAMFLKIQSLEGDKRYRQLYSKFPPEKIYVFVKRMNCAKNGEFNVFNRNSAVCYAWFVWKKGFKGDTIVKWLY